MTSEKREPSVEDSMVTQDRELMLNFAGLSVANALNSSNQAGAGDSGGSQTRSPKIPGSLERDQSFTRPGENLRKSMFLTSEIV